MLVAAALTALFWAGDTAHPGPHPLHTSLAEISYQADRRILVIRVRVFADDLSAAIFPAPNKMPPDTLLSRYVRGTFALADPEGRPIPLQWRGARQVGDAVQLEVEAPMPADGPSNVRVLHAMLWERFPDQVNIVRASYNGRTNMLLFTRGDRDKELF